MSTTDPGNEGAISQAAAKVESDDQPKGYGREEDSYMQASTWWFASTACPLLAGTFGPLASGFSICALVYHWRVYIPDGGTEEQGEKIQDPHWLVSGP